MLHAGVCSLLVSEVFLEEDSKQMESTKPQTINQIFDLLMRYVWELTYQPCCNTDLAPSNFHVFGALKDQRVSKRFATGANLKQDVAFCLQTQDTIFFSHRNASLGAMVNP